MTAEETKDRIAQYATQKKPFLIALLIQKDLAIESQVLTIAMLKHLKESYKKSLDDLAPMVANTKGS